MIDTDKYEGHTPAPWRWVDSSTLEGENTVCELSQGIGEGDAQLVADAPLLLEEVKRLKDEVEERITAHYILANGWSRAEQEWEQEKRRLLMQIEQLKEMNE